MNQKKLHFKFFTFQSVKFEMSGYIITKRRKAHNHTSSLHFRGPCQSDVGLCCFTLTFQILHFKM